MELELQLARQKIETMRRLRSPITSSPKQPAQMAQVRQSATLQASATTANEPKLDVREIRKLPSTFNGSGDIFVRSSADAQIREQGSSIKGARTCQVQMQGEHRRKNNVQIRKTPDWWSSASRTHV
ncbi:hypothetical protein KM043_014450 [Ampulex compressa]|nr:hypothetical protein KM043_014450 [Ampulex compressa]